jgi:hypothetical protein
MVNRALLPILLTVISFLLFGGTASAAKLDAPWIGGGDGTPGPACGPRSSPSSCAAVST